MRVLLLLCVVAATAACSSSSYHQGADGSVTYHAANVLDKSDFEVTAMLGRDQGSASMTIQEPVLDTAGNPIAITSTSFDFPPGSVLRITKGADRTEVGKEGVRVWGAVESLKTWVRGDVAKHTETERTVREGIQSDAATRQAGVGALETLGRSEEPSESAIREVGRMAR